MNINITKEELIAAWGQDFFEECYKEAEKLRGPNWHKMVPAALVLAVAIGKLNKRMLPMGK